MCMFAPLQPSNSSVNPLFRSHLIFLTMSNTTILEESRYVGESAPRPSSDIIPSFLLIHDSRVVVSDKKNVDPIPDNPELHQAITMPDANTVGHSPAK